MAFLQRYWDRMQEMWAPFHADSGEASTAMAKAWRADRLARLKAEVAELEAAQ